jgi:hypothetical protein
LVVVAEVGMRLERQLVLHLAKTVARAGAVSVMPELELDMVILVQHNKDIPVLLVVLQAQVLRGVEVAAQVVEVLVQ